MATTSNKSLNALLVKVIKQATIEGDSFYSRVRVTAKQKTLVEKFCKNYEFTTDSGVTYEVNFSNPQNDQLPIYFYGKVIAEISFAIEPVKTKSINKTHLKKDLATAKRELKEVSKEYDRTACRSVNPDVDMAVIRVLGRKYELQTKVTELAQQLADCLAS